MKKSRRIYLVCLFIVQALSAQDNQFHIHGKISPDYNGKRVILYTANVDAKPTIDSTKIENGIFIFNGAENTNVLSYLFVDSLKDQELSLMLEKGDISVSIGKEYTDYRIGGTALNQLYQTYCDSDAIYSKQIIELLSKNKDINAKNKSSLKITKGSELEKKYSQLGGFSVEFKKKNLANPVGKALFKKALKGSFSEYIWGHGTDSAFHLLYNLADEKLKSDPAVIKYFKRKEADAQQKDLQINLIGKKYHNISLIATNGQKYKVSDLIGKSNLVLIDFWASWCNPCIEAIPELYKINEKYKSKGLQIIGLSEDINKQSWTKMLAKLNAPWSQFMIDGFSKEISAQLYDNYGLKGIPYCVVINKIGNIVHVGHFPTDTEFEELFGK